MKNIPQKATISILITLVLILSSGSSAFARPFTAIQGQQEINTAITSGVDYLMTQMNADGGIRWTDENSNMAASIRVVQALAAAGYTQDYLTSEAGNRPIDFIAENASAWINQEGTENPEFSVARAGQLLTALAAANKNPHQFGPDDLNLIREIKHQYDLSSGIYGTATPENVMDQVWAMIGLAANNASVPEDAAGWLVSTQAEDGSWNDGFGSTLDTTPLGIMALLSTRLDNTESPSIQSAVNFMRESQGPSGGWQSEWDTNTNANTTAIMLQAINLLGQNPDDEIWQQQNGNPSSALLAVQRESGAFGGDFANAYSTADAIVALAGRSITDLGYLEIASDSYEFVVAAQEDNGGWGSVGQTLDTLIALRAAGWQPNTIAAEHDAPLDYIANNLQPYLETGPDAIGKTILGLIAAGEDPTDFSGVDLTQALRNAYDQEAGSFGSPGNTWHQALAILGLDAAEQEIPQGAIETLVNLQQDDGGWEYSPGFGSSPDNTSLAIQALLAVGFIPDDPVLSNAIQYIRTSQTNSGGWGDSSNTAFALMAINALGDPIADWVTDTGKGPLSNLLSYQKANGAFVYNWELTDDNLMSTVTALMALFDGDYLIQVNPDKSHKQASVIVIPGDGIVYADCVEFDEVTISGLELLERSGFTYNMQEGFLTSIMNVSNPDGETNYWSYWSWNGKEWVFKNSSAGDSKIFSGTVEAWHFTSWETFPSFPPDFIPHIDRICGSEILKSYTSQPYLNYYDLFNVEMQEVKVPLAVQDESVESMTTTPADSPRTEMPADPEPTSISELTPVLREEETPSNLPLMIIAVTGGLVLIVVLVILIKKNK